MCVVRDAHRYRAVVLKLYVPYFPSGRNALCVVRDEHRYSAVVVESYVPYFPSGRNALCVVRDAHCCYAVVVVTQLTFVPKQKIRRDAAAAPRSGDASEHDSLWQPPAAHSEERSRPQKSSRAQRCLNALAPSYLKGTVVRGHPVVWSLALRSDDAKHHPVVYGTKFAVGGSTYCIHTEGLRLLRPLLSGS